MYYRMYCACRTVNCGFSSIPRVKIVDFFLLRARRNICYFHNAVCPLGGDRYQVETLVLCQVELTHQPQLRVSPAQILPVLVHRAPGYSGHLIRIQQG
jgi:hypothetical protein